jgi:predicted dehydrogenase
VSCFGSGVVNDEVARRTGARFAVETCHIKIKDFDVAAHVWRSLWDTARQYRESIDVYGSKKSFEWELITGEQPVLHTAKRPEPEIAECVEVPDFAHLLPEPIRKFTRGIVDEEHLSFIQGGGHGGSHPHMVNEFITALREDRDPFPNVEQAANWTAVGICAHQSALRGGEIVAVPDFTRR